MSRYNHQSLNASIEIIKPKWLAVIKWGWMKWSSLYMGYAFVTDFGCVKEFVKCSLSVIQFAVSYDYCIDGANGKNFYGIPLIGNTFKQKQGN